MPAGRSCRSCMFAYNGSATACVTETEPGLKCFIYTHPPYLSAEAIKLAVDMLDGTCAGLQDNARRLSRA